MVVNHWFTQGKTFDEKSKIIRLVFNFLKHKYSQFTMLCQFQGHSKVVHIYIFIYIYIHILYMYFFFRFFSNVGYYKILSIVPSAIPQVRYSFLRQKNNNNNKRPWLEKCFNSFVILLKMQCYLFAVLRMKIVQIIQS